LAKPTFTLAALRHAALGDAELRLPSLLPHFTMLTLALL
tara:strand:+ start:296 stop:412 length:117 start_codon:yes stop_codon:yes gene_type:complete